MQSMQYYNIFNLIPIIITYFIKKHDVFYNKKNCQAHKFIIRYNKNKIKKINKLQTRVVAIIPVFFVPMSMGKISRHDLTCKID